MYAGKQQMVVMLMLWLTWVTCTQMALVWFQAMTQLGNSSRQRLRLVIPVASLGWGICTSLGMAWNRTTGQLSNSFSMPQKR